MEIYDYYNIGDIVEVDNEDKTEKIKMKVIGYMEFTNIYGENSAFFPYAQDDDEYNYALLMGGGVVRCLGDKENEVVKNNMLMQKKKKVYNPLLKKWDIK